MALNKNCMLFAPTNGSGLGHLTRSLAIARRVKRLAPEMEIVFFSTSPAMHLILREQFLGYHLPPKSVFPPSFTTRLWNKMLEEQIRMILYAHRPGLLVFDGAVPYAGLVRAMRDEKQLARVWIRKDQIKDGKQADNAKREADFDAILIPGEEGVRGKMREDRQYLCDPVLYLDRAELLSRADVRAAWQVPPQCKLVYVQLGAGNSNDISPMLAALLQELLDLEDVMVVLGESMIGKRLPIFKDRVLVIRDYPNSLYFNAFDLAISASGYNTFHELMYFGVPTIFVPNEQTGMDDQLARATYAEKAGAALILRSSNAEDIRIALEKALDPVQNCIMRAGTQKLVRANGAEQIANFLLRMSES